VPWIINSDGKIFRRNSSGTGWDLIPGRARDIDIGRDGSVYIIGAAASAWGGGYQIWKWNGTGWNLLDGGAEKIAVSPSGVAWVVNSRGEIFRRNSSGTGWNLMPAFDTGIDGTPGRARDIDIGANGSVFIIGTLTTSGGYKIYEWYEEIESRWYPVNGGATKITVSPEGVPWIINSAQTLYQRLH
jgi:hypothetical protein